MHRYFIKTPWIVRRLFPAYTWRMPAEGRSVYLSFDDGPHPEVTPWVLDELKKHRALASFFCIGKNVLLYPEVYRRILDEGHSVGNHTHNHLNGWKTSTNDYLDNVRQAAGPIQSRLFRPPYGRIRSAQARGIGEALGVKDSKIVMWDVLSGDFDHSFSPEQCRNLVMKYTEAGSVVVFHDSEKARKNLEGSLPQVLGGLGKRGYRFQPIV